MIVNDLLAMLYAHIVLVAIIVMGSAVCLVVYVIHQRLVTLSDLVKLVWIVYTRCVLIAVIAGLTWFAFHEATGLSFVQFLAASVAAVWLFRPLNLSFIPRLNNDGPDTDNTMGKRYRQDYSSFGNPWRYSNLPRRVGRRTDVASPRQPATSLKGSDPSRT